VNNKNHRKEVGDMERPYVTEMDAGNVSDKNGDD
jgi:hypothetical protein